MEKRLSDLLARLPIPGLKESNERHITAQIITEIIKVPVTPSQIKIKDQTLSLATVPILKNVIIINTSEIIQKLLERNIIIRAIK